MFERLPERATAPTSQLVRQADKVVPAAASIHVDAVQSFAHPGLWKWEYESLYYPAADKSSSFLGSYHFQPFARIEAAPAR